jgi:PST family polysaccharide transporter
MYSGTVAGASGSTSAPPLSETAIIRRKYVPPSADYFSSDALRLDLKGKTLRGGLATGLAQVCLGAMSLATIPILSRLLHPSDFGLVAMVTVVTGFAAMFVDAGLSMATIQQDKITRQQVTNLFWFAVALGSGIALIVASLSPAIAWFYGEPRLIPITLASAVSFVLSGLTIQHRALLRRALQFRALTTTQVIANAAGHIVAVYWAWQYQSYWALVLRPIVAAGLQAIGSWWACPWRPSWPRRETGVRKLAYFGFNLTAVNMITYFTRNADNMLIGWYWGASPLGFYDRAYRLLMLPINQINFPIASVAVPALSRLQNEPAKYLRAYESLVGKLIYASGTLIGFMIVTPDWIIEVLLGRQWLESVSIFQWLAVVSVRQMFAITTVWLFISQGRSREYLYWGIIGTAITVGSFVVGLPYGPLGVARAYAIIPTFLAVPIIFWMVGQRGPVTTSYLWKLYLFALQVPLTVAAVTALARWIIQPASTVLGLLLLAPLALGTSLALMLATSFGRQQLRQSIEMLRHVRSSRTAKLNEAGSS